MAWQASFLDRKLSRRILQQASSQLAEEEAEATTARKGTAAGAVTFQLGGSKGRRGQGENGEEDSSSGEEQDDLGAWDEEEEEEEEEDVDMVEIRDGAVHSLAAG